MTCIRWMLVLSALISTAGCATAPSGDFCAVASPIRPSVKDVLTDGTAAQILTHDKTGARLCGWR